MTALIREYKTVLRDRNLERANEEGLDPITAVRLNGSQF